MSRLQTTQTTPEINRMLAHARRRRYRHRDYIVRSGAVPDTLYLLTEGSVTVYVEDEDGNELILAYLGPGMFFGELGLFDDSAGRSAWVRARTDCEVAYVGYTDFLALCREEPGLWMQLTGQIAERLRQTSRKIGHLAFLDVSGRIARALLDLAADSEAITHPDGMLVRISREELGRLVNCSREMAGRVLHNLAEQGLIQIDGRSIIVHGTR